MDSITAAIVAALATGVVSAATDISKQSLVDAYAHLKFLLRKKFGHSSEVMKSVESLEVEPNSVKKQRILIEEITTLHADQDPELVQAAKELFGLVQPQQASMGKYNVQITGNVHGYAQGDSQQITMNFGNESKKE